MAGMVPSDTRQPWDMRGVLERILDGSRFDEFKKLYGSTLITGFGSICGQTVGVVANDGILFSESALKGKESSPHAQLLLLLTWPVGQQCRALPECIVTILKALPVIRSLGCVRPGEWRRGSRQTKCLMIHLKRVASAARMLPVLMICCCCRSPLHTAVLAEGSAPDLPAEHQRLHGGAEV